MITLIDNDMCTSTDIDEIAGERFDASPTAMSGVLVPGSGSAAS